MAFRDFAFPDVQQALGLNLAEADLFSGIPALELPSTFVDWMRSGIDLALAINTEKARSEFIIAPVLLELKRLLGGRFGLFSGVEFNVDAARGLNGYCDFILTKSPLQSVLTAPIIVITEAKNDNLRTGLGQCIAAMVAAREFNVQAPAPVATVYGAVTTGAAWKFLRLAGSAVTLDVPEYFVAELGRIMGILSHILHEPKPISVDDVEACLGIEFPSAHRRALLDASDPIHKRVLLLMPEGNECQSILKVNEELRQIEWKEWPSHLIAFATNECGDYFAYDTREKPYRVYYIDPIGTVAERVSECEDGGFVLPAFDDWYNKEMSE